MPSLKLTREETEALNEMSDAQAAWAATFAQMRDCDCADELPPALKALRNAIQARYDAAQCHPAYKTAKLKQMFDEMAAHPVLPVIADATRELLPLVVEGPVADLLNQYDGTMAHVRAKNLMVQREALKGAGFSESFAEEYLLRSATSLTALDGAFVQALLGHFQNLLVNFGSPANILPSGAPPRYGMPGSEPDFGVAGE